ncbi:MAG TPA: dihydrodipicolinate synthase family protein, partial [Alphaproteobacteria bacterium]|nr:dihydrodipicolinate synthase family protein [Alphaproteobacteria bacterium]
FDVLVRIFEQMSNGSAENAAQADALYAGLLPLLVFLMESIDTLLVYGKRVLGHRLGIEELDPRIPFTPPTAFGLATVRRYAEALGKF